MLTITHISRKINMYNKIIIKEHQCTINLKKTVSYIRIIYDKIRIKLTNEKRSYEECYNKNACNFTRYYWIYGIFRD